MSAGAPVVGVIGTGAMGMGVVRSLLRAGRRPLTRDIRREAEQEARALGATPCESAAELATHADIAILLVVDDSQIDDVLFGANGALLSLRPGSVVVASSTLDPRYVASLAPRLRDRDVHLVDAPVSGGPRKAADATMTMMVAGNAQVRAHCRPVFDDIAGRVFEVGDTPGQAATFKIVNNLLAAVNLAAGAEALAIARRAGIDRKAALDVINASSGASWIVAERMARALAGDEPVHAATRILAKDVGIAAALAQRLAAHAPFALAARDAFAAAVEAGYGDDDDASLLRYFEARQ
jgi:3-hydroxyisobutyrate dehydrogenase-like beta-hydroxyacid dehydrogenase